jgi:hypothetical protein
MYYCTTLVLYSRVLLMFTVGVNGMPQNDTLDQCCGSGSGIPCLFGPWIRNPGWIKSQDPELGSGMNNPDHISESLQTIFWIKILKFFDVDSGCGKEKIRIRDPK